MKFFEVSVTTLVRLRLGCTRPGCRNRLYLQRFMAKRLAWAHHMVEVGHTSAWYFQWVIWIDLCHSLLPRTEAKAKQQALARKGKKGWVSPDQAEYSRNLKGNEVALKQNSWGIEKIWWIPVMVRGKLHVELLPSTFPGEKPEAVDAAIGKIPGILNVRFPNENKPRIVMSDRGPAFYHLGAGKITPDYKESLHRHGLRALTGEDASTQPGGSQEVLLHETAVAWLRRRLAMSLPAKPWLETREEFGARLKEQAAYINNKFNVDALCRAFPLRLDQLIAKEGDRIRK